MGTRTSFISNRNEFIDRERSSTIYHFYLRHKNKVELILRIHWNCQFLRRRVLDSCKRNTFNWLWKWKFLDLVMVLSLLMYFCCIFNQEVAMEYLWIILAFNANHSIAFKTSNDVVRWLRGFPLLSPIYVYNWQFVIRLVLFGSML